MTADRLHGRRHGHARQGVASDPAPRDHWRADVAAGPEHHARAAAWCWRLMPMFGWSGRLECEFGNDNPKSYPPTIWIWPPDYWCDQRDWHVHVRFGRGLARGAAATREEARALAVALGDALVAAWWAALPAEVQVACDALRERGQRVSRRGATLVLELWRDADDATRAVAEGILLATLARAQGIGAAADGGRVDAIGYAVDLVELDETSR
jgi:hypothetical protein